MVHLKYSAETLFVSLASTMLAFLFVLSSSVQAGVDEAYNTRMSNSIIDEYLPRFVDPFHNVTVMEGRDAILACTVNNLGDYKVAWVKVDTQTILTVGMNPITRDSRFKVTQSNQQNWYLHISKVLFEDKGLYMCQVNTKPMRHRNIYLEILVPPKVIESKTSSGVTVKEFKSVSLQCCASGYPKPTITWQREDNKVLKVDSDDERHQQQLQHQKHAVRWKDGEFLNISRVTRHHMGAYLCIAANDVPPSVSKRIVLEVTFAPRIRVPHQLVGVLEGSDVILTCEVEAFPVPMTSWQKYDKLIVSDDRYQSIMVRQKMYTTIMQLTIRRLTTTDFGAYKCSATNILGTKQGLIRLYKTETFGEDQQAIERKHSSSEFVDDHIILFPYKKALSNNDVNRQGETQISVYSAKVIDLNATRNVDKALTSTNNCNRILFDLYVIPIVLFGSIHC